MLFTFGSMVGDKRQGFALFAAMLVIFIAFLGLAIWTEGGGNTTLSRMGVSQIATELQPGGNMEGKEVRFGVVPSCAFAVTTTSASCGAVNSMHDSYTPLGGMAPLILMQFGEVVFGGVGLGLSGMLVFVIIAVFLAGLMIGRMPDYLSKKIGPYEMRLCVAIILLPIVIVLTPGSCCRPGDGGRGGSPRHRDPVCLHPATNNNWSAFAGLLRHAVLQRDPRPPCSGPLPNYHADPGAGRGIEHQEDRTSSPVPCHSRHCSSFGSSGDCIIRGASYF